MLFTQHVVLTCVFYLGDVVFQWFMKMSKDCHSPAEYNRYHAELSCFLGKAATRKALSKKGIAAIFRLKRTLRDKEHKLAGYVRHGIKNNMGAMTTSPTEGQNLHIRHGPDAIGVKYQSHTALRRFLHRVQRNLKQRRQRAHAELARNTLFSRAWTKDFLIRKGQALLDRNHAKRLHLKSARLGPDQFIMWNFDIGEVIDVPNPLYRSIPHFLRVCNIRLDAEPSGANFAKCTCGVREGIGVPCSGFFKLCDDTDVPNDDMIHPCMMDVRYLKLYHTHYGKDCELGHLVANGQTDSFANEGKGTEIPTELMELLVSPPLDGQYPVLGRNTSKKIWSKQLLQ